MTLTSHEDLTAVGIAAREPLQHTSGMRFALSEIHACRRGHARVTALKGGILSPRQTLLILFFQIPEKFIEQTPAPIRWRLALLGRFWLEAEIGRPRGFRDQRRACKHHEQSSGAWKRDDNLERPQSVREPSKHGSDTAAVWLIWR